MKLEQQVCSLEQSKKLKELGISGPCALYYSKSWHTESDLQIRASVDEVGMMQDHARIVMTPKIVNDYCSPAFTVAELGQMLPHMLNHKGKEWYIDTCKSTTGTYWFANVCELGKEGSILIDCSGQTEAQARSAMLIYLLENNLTTTEECNRRLAY